MTASELASALHARRTGKGKWVALCPAHGDHTPSLHIAEGRKRPIVLRCMSQGCSTKAILEAIGLSWEAVMGPGEVTPEMRGRMRQEHRIAELQRRRVWFLLAWAADAPSNRRYWWKCVQNCDAEIQELSDKLNPDGVKIRGQRERVARAMEKFGVDAMLERWMQTERGKMAVQQYGIDPPQGGTT